MTPQPRPVAETLQLLCNDGPSAITMTEGLELERMGFAYADNRDQMPLTFVVTEAGIDRRNELIQAGRYNRA